MIERGAALAASDVVSLPARPQRSRFPRTSQREPRSLAVVLPLDLRRRLPDGLRLVVERGALVETGGG